MTGQIKMIFRVPDLTLQGSIFFIHNNYSKKMDIFPQQFSSIEVHAIV
ncbi:hypothetical protein Mucpa_1626 [Mucilaginibacter paludis DSM 18603]|uniref:Uncharacterized protein n=1 Tax=Mucilaginibacter paludis DSM 18603 TaxID=714943 RepID=H1Y4E9_9SPHI|nr:hypothetical protein Mucpa_1626 [Mucilaginibacter paludis DSM 18603]